MSRIAVALLFATAASASAQVIVGPVGTVVRPYAFRYATPHGEVSRYGYQTRPVYGIVGFLPPQPPVVVVNVVPPLPPLAPPGPLPAAQDPLAAALIDDKVKRGDFLVIKPQKNDVRVAGGPMPDVPPPPVGLEPPPIEPKALARYLIDKAREAFGQGEPGRAADRLRAAVELDPAEGLPHFLLAQVHVARGEYPEAVAAIRDGMRREPNWPTVKFDPRGWYARPAEYDADLKALQAASAARPNDPGLLFLCGYQLWFLGDRKEASVLLKKAAARTKETAIIERFLLETVG